MTFGTLRTNSAFTRTEQIWVVLRGSGISGPAARWPLWHGSGHCAARRVPSGRRQRTRSCQRARACHSSWARRPDEPANRLLERIPAGTTSTATIPSLRAIVFLGQADSDDQLTRRPLAISLFRHGPCCWRRRPGIRRRKLRRGSRAGSLPAAGRRRVGLAPGIAE